MSRPSVLIVDDDEEFAAKLAGALEGLFRVEVCYSDTGFRERFMVGRYDLLMMDMRLKTDREGLDLLKEVLARDPLQAAVVMTVYADTETYADAIASGALTYLDKRAFSPVLIARTVEAIMAQGALRRRLAVTERQLAASEHQEMIGFSTNIKAVGKRLRQASEDGDVPVLLMGEPGSGRELAARTLHRWSRRRADGPFVVASCDRTGGMKPAIALFGSLQSSEDTRIRDSRAFIDDAKSGILYLDGLCGLDADGISEIAELIETRHFKRVGGTHCLETDVQIVVAPLVVTDSEIVPEKITAALIARGGLEIRIPPLRERREDIPLIAQFTLQQFYRFGQTQVRSFRGAALAALESQAWPGNVRELRSVIEYAAIRADATAASEIGLEHLPLTTFEGPVIQAASTSTLNYQVCLARAELGLVELAIERFKTTKKSWLAECLQYNDRFTFSRRLRRIFSLYPQLRTEFTRTAALYDDEESGRRKKNESVTGRWRHDDDAIERSSTD